MPINPNVNTVLREMWRIQNIREQHNTLTHSELVYWRDHLYIVLTYYRLNHEKWENIANDWTYKAWTDEEYEAFLEGDNIN